MSAERDRLSLEAKQLKDETGRAKDAESCTEKAGGERFPREVGDTSSSSS